MPVDSKRITGPDTSVAYRFYSKINLKTYEEKLNDLFKTKTTRLDDRQPEDARKIFLKSGVISQAKGSAYIELGQTKVIVSVFDPREIPKQNKYSINGELFCDFKYSSFACTKRRLPQTDAEEKSLAQSMKRALLSAVCRHEFPNFQVDVFANVIEDDGSALGAAITCAGLALADAGIPMYDVITASTVGVIGDCFLMDPSRAEEDVCGTGVGDREHGLVMMSCLATHEQVSEIWQAGCLSLEKVDNVCKMLVKANSESAQIVKQLLVGKVMKHIKKVEKENTIF